MDDDGSLVEAAGVALPAPLMPQPATPEATMRSPSRNQTAWRCMGCPLLNRNSTRKETVDRRNFRPAWPPLRHGQRAEGEASTETPYLPAPAVCEEGWPLRAQM
jgi:hypothetical protein